MCAAAPQGKTELRDVITRKITKKGTLNRAKKMYKCDALSFFFFLSPLLPPPCCSQVNRFNKSTDRGLLVTDKYVYKLEPKKQNFLVLKRLPLDGVSTHTREGTHSRTDTQAHTAWGEHCLNQGDVFLRHCDRPGLVLPTSIHQHTEQCEPCSSRHGRLELSTCGSNQVVKCN